MKFKSSCFNILLALIFIVCSASVLTKPIKTEAAGTINKITTQSSNTVVHADYQDANTNSSFKKKWSVFGATTTAKTIQTDGAVSDGMVICLYDISDPVSAYKTFQKTSYVDKNRSPLKYVQFGTYTYMGKEYYCAYSYHSYEPVITIDDPLHITLENPNREGPQISYKTDGIRTASGGVSYSNTVSFSNIDKVEILKNKKSGNFTPVKVTYSFDHRNLPSGKTMGINYSVNAYYGTNNKKYETFNLTDYWRGYLYDVSVKTDSKTYTMKDQLAVIVIRYGYPWQDEHCKYSFSYNFGKPSLLTREFGPTEYPVSYSPFPEEIYERDSNAIDTYFIYKNYEQISPAYTDTKSGDFSIHPDNVVGKSYLYVTNNPEFKKMVNPVLITTYSSKAELINQVK